MAPGPEVSGIDIYVRIKPVQKPSPKLIVDTLENKLEFNIPRNEAAGLINNQREHYEFRFNGIVTADAKQDEVFERVARPVVMGAMEGYNGTIFAYGQTGSGKTFTITGGPERYVDRGIIPRSVSAIFTEISKRSDFQYTVHISYLEIYNNEGYDLLDADREIKSMEDLQRVHLGEADDGTVSYRNLSMYRANNEEEALNLLFLGDTNRTISETPMNQASSRSHCIFTIHVEARKSGEDVVRRSKLNLVDLAGSERVSKTGVDGTTLREAKYINLSLHYLEQVIIALQEKAMGMNRPHIPYRNSMMTMALKDSLGGNCRTVMIATVTSAGDQMDESISTCRFAQRVAMVRNTVMLNEELDPSLIIRRLKQEVRELREEVRLLKGEEEERGPLTPDEINRLQGQVESYVSDDSPDAGLSLGGSMMMIRAVFEIFKRLLKTGGFRMAGSGAAGGGGGMGGGGGGKDPGTPTGAGGGGGGGSDPDAQEQIRKLKLQVAQRDNEIGILVSMLKRREAAGGPTKGPVLASPSSSTSGPLLQGSGGSGSGLGLGLGPGGESPGPAGPGPSSLAAAAAGGGQGGLGGGGGVAEEMAALMNTNLLADRNKAFELFRKSYRQNEVIEENKALLKAKYEAAKGLGAAVNDSKGRITELRQAIEQRRMQLAASAVAQGLQPEDLPEDAEEQRHLAAMEQEKTRYKDAFGQLRELKKEIEHLHMLLEQSRTRLQRDFEQWMGLMLRQQQQQQQQAGGPGAGLPPQAPSPGMSPMRPPHSGAPPAGPRQAWGDAAATGSPSASGSWSSGRSGAGPGPGGGSGGAGAGGGGGPPPQWAVAASRLVASPSTSQSYSGPNGQPAPANGFNGFPAAEPSSSAGFASPPVMRSSSGTSLRSHMHPHGPGPGPGSGPGQAHGLSASGGFQGVDPSVLEAARPFLTGNPDADADIVKFYEAKAKLLQKLNTG
ncbi:hypothetical protein HYH03_005837 [Edaphochlamys debaryana]|uniref:Kinesin-like protein n=1 Tax=Edaphochlamys debaryana TaxID=47281 RepID=A0A836C261_9CHLO|nr:hypothetical protein HYH03_005837 [Edaphochlamys debaryana]|eukprot:KAG2496239.1 hypothetical protein HYH03_005837 [Edaphochlamys debaryana]